MIPYEELERALGRWKARRSGTVESPALPLEGDETPAAPGVSRGPRAGTTTEVELSDAEVVDEA